LKHVTFNNVFIFQSKKHKKTKVHTVNHGNAVISVVIISSQFFSWVFSFWCAT